MKIFGLTKMFTLLGILILLFASNSWSAPVQADETTSAENKVSSLLSLHIKQKEIHVGEALQGSAKLLGVDSASSTETTLINRERVYLHFTQQPTDGQIAELKTLGVAVFADSWVPPVNNFQNGFVLAEMPVEHLDALTAKDYIVSLDTAEQQLSLQNDQARAAMNVDPVWSGGDTGAGVSVAVIDSGLDTHNPDFPTPVAAIDYSNYPIKDDSVANTVTGHGTHVTGSLLGRGVNSATYKGVAPGAGLVFIKVGNDTDGSISSDAMTYAIRDAVDVYHVKIINISIGIWSEYHDGTDQWCQAVDYATSQGTTVFAAAGNDASSGWHYSGTLAASSMTEDIPITATTKSYLSSNLVWFDGLGAHNNLTLQYFDANHKLLSPIAGIQSESIKGTESNQYYFASQQNTGTYYLRVHNNSPTSQFFHIYYMGGANTVTFSSPDPNYTITSPGEADSAIAVGAYVTRNSWTNYNGSNYNFVPQEFVGSVASFSSRGPRVDASAPPKPDLVAPGSIIISARDPLYALGNPNYDPAIIDNDGQNLNGSGPANYFVMEGTSMASPIAAGVGALILNQNPAYTPALIKQALESTATDQGTSGWDHIYGWGLINASLSVNSHPVLDSYSDHNFSISCDQFSNYSTQHTVYISGKFFLPYHNYQVVYYDGSNKQVAIDYVTTGDSTANAFAISSKHTFIFHDDQPGNWHVIACDAVAMPPGTYDAEWTSTISTDTFSVQSSAIFQSRLVFITASQNLIAGAVSNTINLQSQDPSGNPVNVTSNTTIYLTTTSNAGRFDTSNSGTFDDNFSSVIIPDGSNSVSFFYKDTLAGNFLISAAGDSFVTATQQEIVVPAKASQIRVENDLAGNGSLITARDVITGISISAYAISRDQFGNFVANVAAIWSLDNFTGGVLSSDLVSASDSKSAVFTGHSAGTAAIRVTSGGLTSIDSGIITVIITNPWSWGSNLFGQLGNGVTANSYIPVQVTISGVSNISAGDEHSLALQSNGTVWAWGFNSFGQLGNGTNSNSDFPVQVIGVDGITAIAAGGYHSLALKSDGTVWAWGDNTWGQLGNSTSNPSNLPVQVSGLSEIIALASGWQSSLALKSDGTVWAWGENYFGQLGTGDYSASSVPVIVKNLSQVNSIASGGYHSLALRSDGSVWTWGMNTSGQLGNGSMTNSNLPVQVNSLVGVSAIAGGSEHSLALESNGTVWAWGSNKYGQLGSETNVFRILPTKVASLSGVNAIGAGGYHSLALKSGGAVWTWGYNYYGQLGNGTGIDNFVPAQIKGLKGINIIDGGQGNSVAAKSDGTVWTWGYNGEGELGNGLGSSADPGKITGLAGVISLAAGGYHSLALKSDGTVWAWGMNYYGELGTGNNNYSSLPIQINEINGVTAIAAGTVHSLALKLDGTVWAWGSNQSGQLGNQTTVNTNSPTQVSNLSGVIAIACGGYHSLAVKSDGTVWTWGYNNNGELGNGNLNFKSLVPVQTLRLNDVIAVAGGGYHSLALKSDGTVWTWGYNQFGELGNGTNSNSYLPVQVSSLSGIVAVSGGWGFSLGLKSDGTVWSWGSNQYGQLGNGTLDSNVPIQVNGLNRITAISAGTYHGLILKSDGTVWALGYNYDGELGNGTLTNSNSPVQVNGLSGVSSICAGGYHNLAIKPDSTQESFITLTSSINPSYYGQLVTFSANVSGIISAEIPGGTVTFQDGDTYLGTGIVDSSGRATFSTSALSVGSHDVTAIYQVSGNFLVSMGLVQNIRKSGDASIDGVVNMADVTLVERIILGLNPPTAGADANGDGTINMGDVTKIERFILGLDPL